MTKKGDAADDPDYLLINKGLTAQSRRGARARAPAKGRSAGKSAWARPP